MDLLSLVRAGQIVEPLKVLYFLLNKHHIVRFKLVKVLKVCEYGVRNICFEELIHTFPEMMMILYLLGNHHSAVLRLEKVILLIVNKIVYCTLIPVRLRCGGRVVEPVTVLPSHKGLREKLLIGYLNIGDDIPHHSLEPEFLKPFRLECIVV